MTTFTNVKDWFADIDRRRGVERTHQAADAASVLRVRVNETQQPGERPMNNDQAGSKQVTEVVADALVDSTAPTGRDAMMARMKNGGKDPSGSGDASPPTGRDAMMARMKNGGKDPAAAGGAR